MALQLDTLNYEIENGNIEFKDFKMSINEVKQKIEENNRKIEDLGAVNMRAIEQYDQELNRYKSTDEKYKILLSERNDLIELQNQIIEDEKRIFHGSSFPESTRLNILETVSEKISHYMNPFFVEDYWGNTRSQRANFILFLLFLERADKIRLTQEEPFGNIQVIKLF